ncbi:hypothetical protein JOC83_001828 [Bacillus iocasae]|uniref:Uncharacterized protein n=1 Tax=Priestia iocasae TaxID=2291674 RepID=A0ABS2QU32_9BACI|nr:hypothetical protein [Metabacillus iocasae]
MKYCKRPVTVLIVAGIMSGIISMFFPNQHQSLVTYGF